MVIPADSEDNSLIFKYKKTMVVFLVIALVTSLMANVFMGLSQNLARKAYKRIGEHMSSLSEKLVKLEHEKDEMDEKFQRSEDKRFFLIDENEKLKESVKELEKVQSNYENAEAAYDELDRRTQNEIRDLKSNNKSLSDRLLSSGNELANVRKELESKNTIIEDLSKAANELRAYNEDLLKKNQSLLSSAGGYEKANKDLRIKIGALAEEYQSLKEKTSDLVNTYNELVDEYNKLVDANEKKSPVESLDDTVAPEEDKDEGVDKGRTEMVDDTAAPEVTDEAENAAPASEDPGNTQKKPNIKFGKKKKNKKR